MRTTVHPRGYTQGEVIVLAAAIVGIGLSSFVLAQDMGQPPQSEAAPTAPTSPPLSDGEPEEQPVNPQECRDVQRQIKDQLRELRRIEPKLKRGKLGADVERLDALRSRIEQFQSSFRGGCTRDEIQEFYDEQPWETINELRAKAELPQQHAQMERELKRLERRLTAKFIAAAGLDAEKLRANVAAVRAAIEESKRELASGNFQEAQEALQTIYDGMHPGEIMAVVDRLREIGTNLKRVKDADIRGQIQELVQPIMDSANEGDFREANQALNEVFSELQRVMSQVMRSRRYRGNFSQKMDQLERLIEGKLESGEQSTTMPVPEKIPVPVPDAIPAVPAPVGAG